MNGLTWEASEQDALIVIRQTPSTLLAVFCHSPVTVSVALVVDQ